eukprot:TRINITY_DN2893_c0_g1_i1.p1 TRINITY_DN2893_c0_g1~~TRINITY_DN2893_c0_g1_i1.p1  ORF type:complete len:307 (+),score=69.73 TRINITY_DN2893_c0_g1_i1:111-923(+)
MAVISAATAAQRGALGARNMLPAAGSAAARSHAGGRAQRRHAAGGSAYDLRTMKNLTILRRPRKDGWVPPGMKKEDKGQRAEATVTVSQVDESTPWMYQRVDEEVLGESRSLALQSCHKLEYQRLYVPDLRIPGQDDIHALGDSPKRTFCLPHDKSPFVEPAADKYTPDGLKLLRSELFWARDSVRQQLDGFAPKRRAELTEKMTTAVPVPSLDWNVQFPMWNPRKKKPARPKKGYLMYLFAFVKGSRYQWIRAQRGRNGYPNATFRGLA